MEATEKLKIFRWPQIYDSSDLKILLKGKNFIIIRHISPSIAINDPFTSKEYINGGTPSGAYEPKKATPEIK